MNISQWLLRWGLGWDIALTKYSHLWYRKIPPLLQTISLYQISKSYALKEMEIALENVKFGRCPHSGLWTPQEVH